MIRNMRRAILSEVFGSSGVTFTNAFGKSWLAIFLRASFSLFYNSVLLTVVSPVAQLLRLEWAALFILKLSAGWFNRIPIRRGNTQHNIFAVAFRSEF